MQSQFGQCPNRGLDILSGASLTGHITDSTPKDVTVTYHVCTRARAHKLLYTRVRASGMAVSDLQNTGEFGRFAMPALSLLPQQNNPTRGVGGGTIAGGNLLFIAQKTFERFDNVTKNKVCRDQFLQVVPSEAPKCVLGLEQ